MPDGWAWCRLPEICVIPITDGTHQTPTYCDKENGVPFLSSKDVTSGKIDWSKIKYITKELHQELQKRIAPKKDDILLAKNGTTGVAAIVEDETIFDIYVTLAVIRPNQKIVYPEFLLNIINSPFCKNQFNEHLTGIGVPNLHLVDINKTFIPLPPLNEQRQITDKIGSYTVHIDELEKNKSDLQTAIKQAKSKILDLAIHGKLVPQDPNDEPAEVLLKRIATSDNRPYKKFEEDEVPFIIPFNWKWERLAKISSIISKGTTPRGGKNAYCIEGINYLRVENISADGTINLEDINHISENEHLTFLKRSILQENDVIISIAGTLGKIGIIRKCDLPMNTNQAIAFVRISNLSIINLKYLRYVLESVELQRLLLSQTKVTSIPNLTLEIINNCPIPLPPIQEQNRIVSKIEELFSDLDSISSNLE